MFSLTITAVTMTAVYACAAWGSEAQTTEAADVEACEQLLQDVSGTYDELFSVICDPQYDQVWLDKCEAIVGPDMAQMCADMLKSA